MKSTIASLVLFLIITASTGAQEPSLVKRTRYAFELYQFITGSGFPTGTELNLTVIPDRSQNISLGVFYCPEQNKISGVTIHHERAILRYTIKERAVPYVLYNFVYRFTRTGVVLPGQEFETQHGLYKSLEHHLGVGLDVKIIGDLHIKSAIGYGAFFGSIKKPTAPDPITGEARGSNGFGGIAKIGITYIL